MKVIKEVMTFILLFVYYDAWCAYCIGYIWCNEIYVLYCVLLRYMIQYVCYSIDYILMLYNSVSVI